MGYIVLISAIQVPSASRKRGMQHPWPLVFNRLAILTSSLVAVLKS
jgi:hypothetical protein